MGQHQHESVRRQAYEMRSSLRFCLSNQRRYAASLVEAFQKISSNRVTHLNFADTKVSPIILRRVLELTQHAPTSFNLQPYKIIVVDDKIAKEGLATAMLGGNGRKVLNASATVVFLADKSRY